MINFSCKNCRESLEAPESLSGDMLKCPECHDINKIPAKSTIKKTSRSTPEAPPTTYQNASRSTFKDFCSFRDMISPLLIKIIFWIGVACITYSGVNQIVLGFKYDSVKVASRGFMMIILGILVIRIICESLILLFNIHDALQDIRQQNKPKNRRHNQAA